MAEQKVRIQKVNVNYLGKRSFIFNLVLLSVNGSWDLTVPSQAFYYTKSIFECTTDLKLGFCLTLYIQSPTVPACSRLPLGRFLNSAKLGLYSMKSEKSIIICSLIPLQIIS